MDKLLILCDIFSLNMDELVKGNISLDNDSFKEDKALYENAQNKFSKMITLGVFLILLGVTIMSMSDGLINGGNFFINTFSSISTILFFILVTIAVFIFVYFGINHAHFVEEHPYFDDFYTKEEKSAYNRLFAGMMAVGVGIILVAVTILVGVEEILKTDVDDIPAAIGLFMFMITIAVSIFTYFGMQKAKYDINGYNKENKHHDIYSPEKNSLIGKVSGVIMLIATFIYLSLGFIWNLWHPGWVVFPLSGVLCAIATIIIGDDK
ncbi:hypothetical protein [Anaerofustis stercorihominis]|uniref:XRE family transcriptional regulator n=1 Tax=Anaerofustis stercorihominis TaxID=214853 RepID=A0A3E3E0X3_9FIRM|nr:hypothetical protein [Anaerofustis stercorihominis]RGD75197.1 hypothetical protein DW687_02420 [Anaerofustis stercorihominis]